MAAMLELPRLRAFPNVSARVRPAGLVPPRRLRTGVELAGGGSRAPAPAAAAAQQPPRLPAPCPLKQARPDTLQPLLPPSPTAPRPQASYTSSRNRQWHVFTVLERQKPSAPALKRVFLRWGGANPAAQA